MRLRVFFTVLVSDLLTVMICMFYTVFLVSLLEKVISLSGICYWVVLGLMFVFLLFVSFRYYSQSFIDVSLGRDVNPERDSAWAVYFGVFISSLFVAAVILQDIDKAFPLAGASSFVVTAVVFIMVFVGFFICVKKLRRRK
jgi:hypothetical protein